LHAGKIDETGPSVNFATGDQNGDFRIKQPNEAAQDARSLPYRASKQNKIVRESSAFTSAVPRCRRNRVPGEKWLVRSMARKQICEVQSFTERCSDPRQNPAIGAALPKFFLGVGERRAATMRWSL